VDGLPYIINAASTGEAVEFGPSPLAAAASIADPATHLTVVRQGRFIGFRSDAAGGKMLQARKRGASKLCLFNLNFGINEQWETNDEPRGSGVVGRGDTWSSATMRLRNRRLPSFVLKLEVMRVPEDMQQHRRHHELELAPAPEVELEPEREGEREWKRKREQGWGTVVGNGQHPSAPSASAPQSEDDDGPTGDTNGTTNETAAATAAAQQKEEDRADSNRHPRPSSCNPVRRMVAYHEQTIEMMEKNNGRIGAVPARPPQPQPRIPPHPGPRGSSSSISGHGSHRGSHHGASSSPGRPPPGHRRDPAGEEQGNALRSMSGVLIKEWSAFVLKEVRARKEVEREMLALQEEMRSMALHLRAEISGTRQEWVGDASFYGAEVRGVYEGQAAQRDRVVAFARRSFARQRVMRAMTQWGAVATAATVTRVAFRRGTARMLRAREAGTFGTWRRHALAVVRLRRALIKMSSIHYRHVGITALR
jgi:protein SFI1